MPARADLLIWLFVGCLASAEPIQLPGLAYAPSAAYPGEVVRHVFEIRNTDTTSWKIISLAHSCSCLAIEPTSLDIPPGTSREVPMSFLVGDQVDREAVAQVTARIQRADGVAELPLRIETTVRSPVIAPTRIDFPVGHFDSEIAVARGRHPAPWSDLRPRVASGSEVIRLGTMVAENGGWRIPVQAVPGRWSGTVLGRIELDCLANGRPLPYVPSITVAVRIAGRLVSAPSALLFAAVPKGATMTAAARIRAQSGDLAGATVSTSHPRFTATIDPASGRLTVSFQAESQLGSANGWVDVTLGEDHLRVPLIAAVAPPPEPARPSE